MCKHTRNRGQERYEPDHSSVCLGKVSVGDPSRAARLGREARQATDPTGTIGHEVDAYGAEGGAALDSVSRM